MGRPKLTTEPTVSMTVVALKADIDLLRSIAQREDRSLSWVVRRVLAQGVAAYRQDQNHAL